MTSTPNKLLQLPTEILTAISTNLLNRDVKSLRLTCRALCITSQLRWERVFLSANPLNIQVFRAVAEHEVIRFQISEIIWDDARLKDEPVPRRSAHPANPHFDPNFDPEFDDAGQHDVILYDEYLDDEDEDYGEDDDDDDDEEFPRWFARACKKNLRDIRGFKGNDTVQPGPITLTKLIAPISLERSWKHYQQLLREQREILATNADAKAFEYGLLRFPALRRVTITPAAHGWLLRPLYETPMIRAFPPSFNYPIQCSWPVSKPLQRLWEDTPDSEKDTWRGFRQVMRALAATGISNQQEQNGAHGITEIVVDVNQILTGLNAHIFDEECTELRNLATILRGPNFRRLDLALAVGGLEHYGWRAFRSGCLRRTLAEVPAIEHVSLTVDCEEPDRQQRAPHQFVPLRVIFPVEMWTRLCHFRLSRFWVRQADLFSFLAAMPATLRSVELSFLVFLEGDYRDLLVDVRDQLVWHKRPARQRPRVAIGLVDELGQARRGIWADRPVEEFLYHGGPNPFGADGWSVHQIPFGCGGLVRDALDPTFERPWVDPNELIRQGFVKSLDSI